MQTHYYHGQWHTGNGDTMTSENPATSEIIWQGESADSVNVDAAVKSAKQAFINWSRTTFAHREAILLKYKDILSGRKEELAVLIAQETGKPVWETRTEVAAMIGKVGLSITAYEQRSGSIDNTVSQIQTHLTHRPHGVLVVLGPYNFPAHLPNGHIVPALLAGNTIVFKPSEITPAVGQKLVECLVESGLPQGAVNLLQGGGETGMLLSKHDAIDGLLFTGSSKTGAAIHKQFAGQPGKMLALEMGGNNPLIVHKVQDLKAAAFHTIQSAYITAGQRCTCARRLIIVNDDTGKQFIAQLIKGINDLTVDLPQYDEAAFIGPVVSNKVAEQLLDAQDYMLANGANALIKMQRKYDDKPLLTPGLLDVTDMPQRADEEHFGPLLQLIWVDDLDQAIDEANSTRFGLAAGMLCDDNDSWQQFKDAAHCGILNRNRPTTGASGAAPFGGTGASGNHRPSAFYAADYCAYPMASMEQEKAVLPDDLGVGIKL